MSYKNWLAYLESAEKHSLISGNSRKIFYKFPDGQQMAEEYSMDTGVIQKRAWRKCKQLMGEPEWETELGEEPRQLNNNNMPSLGASIDTKDELGRDFTLRESIEAPILTKRMTKKNIEWRIRNLPYKLDVYDVKADSTKRAIIVRTKNKKYYKEIPVPDLDRCGLMPEQKNLTVHHQFNTLIITYHKPEILCEMDAQVLILLKDVETETDMENILQGLLGKK